MSKTIFQNQFHTDYDFGIDGIVCGVFGLYTQMVLIQTLFYTIFTSINIMVSLFCVNNFLTCVCEYTNRSNVNLSSEVNCVRLSKMDHTNNEK